MHRYVRSLRWILASTVLVALIAGCSGGSSEGASGGEGAGGGAAAASIDVALTEWAVKPSSAKAKAGEVTFNVANGGATVHELAVALTELAVDKLPQAAAAVDETQVPAVGRTAMIDGGKSETKVLNLQAGKYVLYCNIPAHYGQGMYVAFTVE